jgi:hypothetical protein
MLPGVYDLPSPASGDAGLEGFDVVRGDERLGRVAALNAADGGTVLVVETRDGHRVLSLRAVERVELLPRLVALTAAGADELRAAPPVETRVLRADSPRLVRHLPSALARVAVEGEPRPRQRSTLLAFAVAGSAGVLLFVGGPLAFVGPGAGTAAGWLWLAIPAALTVVAVGLLARLENVRATLTAVLGISPRARR